jgi:hypothetical protein
MTRLRAFIAAIPLATALFVGSASPAAADTNIGNYPDCASALSVGSGGTGRMACIDRITAYGPLFQVFSNWTLYYAAPVTVDPRSNVHPNHRWTGAEWVVTGTPANGYTQAHDGHSMSTGSPATCTPSWSYGCQHSARSGDPGVKAWFHGAAADPTLNVIWIDI